MALTTKKTDIPVEERRRMLETLYDAWDQGKVDCNYAALPIPTTTQAHMLVFHYNRLVKPEHHLKPDEAQAILTDPAQGHQLEEDGFHRIYPPTEFLKDGTHPGVMETEQFKIECRNHYEEEGETIFGDANKGDDVQVFTAMDLSRERLDMATEYLDWGVLRELAVKHGYKKQQSADKTRSAGQKDAGQRAGQSVGTG